MRLVDCAESAPALVPVGPTGSPLLTHVVAQAHRPELMMACIRRLLALGADPSACNRVGMNALAVLLSRSDAPLDVGVVLLRAGCTAHRPDNRGLTPLHYLLEANRGEALRHFLPLLLRHGADPKATTPQGFPPLAQAARLPDGPFAVASLLQACTPALRPQMAQATWYAASKAGYNVGAWTLLHQAQDEDAVAILLQLARYGLDLEAAQDLAHAQLDTRTAHRSYAAMRGCVAHASHQWREESARVIRLPQIVITAPSDEALALVAPSPRAARALPTAQAPTVGASWPTQAEPPCPARPPLRPWPTQSLSIAQRPQRQSLGVAKPEPQALRESRPTWPNGTTDAALNTASPSLTFAPRRHVFGVPRAVLAPMALLPAARSGTLMQLQAAIAYAPETLVACQGRRLGGHAPLALAAMREDPRFVVGVLEGLERIGQNLPNVLNATGADRRSALAIAIAYHHAAQLQALLDAGASPTLPIPQSGRRGPHSLGWPKPHGSVHGAAYAVRSGDVAALTCLLAWDDLQTRLRPQRPYAFDVEALQRLAHTKCAPSQLLGLQVTLTEVGQHRQHQRP